MLRVFLVDDEPPARARMRQLLADVTDVVVVGEAEDALDARDAIVAARPDVVFLDIEMPELSGTALAESLPEPRPYIVFATAYDRYALQAFAVDATDYLVKPITRSRLASTLARVRDRLSHQSDVERDLAAASVTQAAMRPRAMPAIPGFEVAALTRAARGVGGDFFVTQKLAADRFVLALGDVAGKGMPAGLIAASVQARLESLALHGAGSASQIVANVNRTLCDASETGRFATLIYLELNPLTKAVAVVNAGHLPALVMTPGAPPQRYASTAPALGLLATARFPVQHVEMTPGATLLVISDGVTEAFNADDEEFGDARLLELLDSQAAAGAQQLCDAIVAAVRRHAPGTPSDDLTVLALRRIAHDEP